MATQKERGRKWYLKNRELTIKRAAEWVKANPEKATNTKKIWLEKTVDTRREYARKWRLEHPTYEEERKSTGYHRKWKYGITAEKFDEMFFNQQGKCAVCSNPFLKPPHVDHDHVTGKNRELLCASCNWLLGYSHESINILKSAINYLIKHGENNAFGGGSKKAV